MAIGRLQAALAAATNEVTVAAANINFDFTLIKCEAPKEYQALGNVLSKRRKENAEFGSSHVLARQLGALFDGVCPPAPALLEAYGKRTSEIAKVAREKSEPFVGTLFGEYTGIDGTSIWAAATSSTCALHIHLLACLLARVWTAPEAVAIWVELVSERKKSIARRVDEGEPVPFALAAAIGQDISRPQLAALDASARAWLQTADNIFCRKQTQLDLILKNLHLPMAGGSSVFPSVIETWKIALETTNKLVSGQPQAVQDGAALLGLSAWHLYPDISMYNSTPIEIKMEDLCIAKGGILSLGVSRRLISSKDEGGVRWSLSLSHLRHYGRPVNVTTGLEANARLTWSQFSLVVFGALLERWKSEGTPSETVARLFASLLQHSDTDPSLKKIYVHMFRFLKHGATAYTKIDSEAQSLEHKLIQLGRRRSRVFLSHDASLPSQQSSILHLLDHKKLFLAFKSTESAISYLRHAARRLSNENTPSDTFLIRQSLPEPERRDSHSHQPPSPLHSSYMMITALVPEVQEGISVASHHRWLPADAHGIPVPNNETSSLNAAEKFRCQEDGLQIVTTHTSGEYIYHLVFAVSETVALFARALPDKPDVSNVTPTTEDWNWCLDHDLVHPHMLFQELVKVFVLGRYDFMETLRAIAVADSVYEDLTNATVHSGVLARPLKDTNWASNAKLWNLRHQDVVSMISYFETGIHDVDPKVLKNVMAFSYADSIFVSNALIQDPYETLSPRRTSHFQRILGNIGKPGLNFLLPPQQPIMREIDAGSWRIDSYNDFDGTMSHSFENTSMHLSFTDYHVPHFDGLQGAYDSQIYFIESVISVQDKDEWVADVDPSPLINPAIYADDIKDEDDTTDEEDTTDDEDVTDEENETDDDDVTDEEGLTIYGSDATDEEDSTDGDSDGDEEGGGEGKENGQSFPSVHRLWDQGPCQHKTNSTPNQNITAVDTWNELLDVPQGMFVVRTGDNWVSRLAATLVAYQSTARTSPNFTIRVCPPQVCWVCALENSQNQAFIF